MYPNNPNSAPAFNGGNAGGLTAFPGVTQFPPPVTGLAPLDELSKQLEGAVSRTFEAASRVKTIADGLFGPIPESPNTVEKLAGRSGKVGNLNDQSEVLHNALSALDNQLSRLASL